jgi:hypothetical protein
MQLGGIKRGGVGEGDTGERLPGKHLEPGRGLWQLGSALLSDWMLNGVTADVL